jgi:F420-dependent methylenetetrahydromethanopterin dehydrogenase
MKRTSLYTIIISILLISSPIVFTQCTALKGASNVASSLSNISEKINYYNQQANHYITVVDKAKKGDVLAIAEAAQLLTKAKDYKKELDTLLPQMTSSQKKEVSKIEQTILNAAKELIK